MRFSKHFRFDMLYVYSEVCYWLSDTGDTRYLQKMLHTLKDYYHEGNTYTFKLRAIKLCTVQMNDNYSYDAQMASGQARWTAVWDENDNKWHDFIKTTSFSNCIPIDKTKDCRIFMFGEGNGYLQVFTENEFYQKFMAVLI